MQKVFAHKVSILCISQLRSKKKKILILWYTWYIRLRSSMCYIIKQVCKLK